MSEKSTNKMTTTSVSSTKENVCANSNDKNKWLKTTVYLLFMTVISYIGYLFLDSWLGDMANNTLCEIRDIPWSAYRLILTITAIAMKCFVFLYLFACISGWIYAVYLTIEHLLKQKRISHDKQNIETKRTQAHAKHN